MVVDGVSTGTARAMTMMHKDKTRLLILKLLRG